VFERGREMEEEGWGRGVIGENNEEEEKEWTEKR